MQTGELAKKIKLLSAVKPDDAWKRSSLEILASQIGAGRISGIEESGADIGIRPMEYYSALASGFFSRIFSRPALSVAVVTAAFLILAVASLKASQETVPGDSLYIAKKVSEKTQLVLTFNEKDKAKLEISFAGNRAKEIVKIIEEGEKKEAVDRNQVEKLSREFKKEINSSRGRLARISARTEPEIAAGQIAAPDPAGQPDSGALEEEPEESPKTEVFSANLNKDDKGIEISESNEAPKAAESAAATTGTTTGLSEAEEDAGASAKKLEEAEKLFDSSDYGGTIDKLEEAGEILNHAKSEDSDSKSASTDATTTQ